MIQQLRKTAIVLIISMVVIFILGIGYQIQQIYKEEKSHLQDKVDIAYSILTYYNYQYVVGNLSLESAQKEAKMEMRQLKFNDDGYFYLISDTCILLTHPLRPEFEGQNMCDKKPYYNDFIKLATQTPEKAGFTKYPGPKPGSKTQDNIKLSYVKNFEPWGWIIGSGTYTDGIDKKIKEISIFYGLLFATFLIVLTITVLGKLYTVIETITPIKEYIKNLNRNYYDFEVDTSSNIEDIKIILDGLEELRKKGNSTIKSVETPGIFNKNYFTTD